MSFEAKKSLLVYYNKKAFDLCKCFDLTIQKQLLLDLQNQDYSLSKKLLNSIYFPVRMASTGSKLAAEIAGKIPDSNPIKAARLVPNRIFPNPRTNSKSKALVKTKAIIL